MMAVTWPPSWICEISWRRTVEAIVWLSCWTPVTWVKHLEFRCSLVNWLRISSLLAVILYFPLPVSPCFVEQHFHHSHWMAGSRKHRYSRLNCIAILCTSWDVRVSSLHAAILDFPLPVSPRLVIQHCHHSNWMAGPRKHRFSRWNCIAILCTSWDIRVSSLHTAILDFPLPLTYLVMILLWTTPV